MQNFVNDNYEAFSEYIRRRYTSCSGFISHYSSYADDWKDETNNFMDYSINGHYLGSVLEFICDELEITDETLYYGMEVNLMVLDYDHETTKVKCEICGEYYSDKDIKADYDNLVKHQIEQIAEFGVVNPKIKPFNQWMKETNYSHC